jgi:hypothetical protein
MSRKGYHLGSHYFGKTFIVDDGRGDFQFKNNSPILSYHKGSDPDTATPIDAFLSRLRLCGSLTIMPCENAPESLDVIIALYTLESNQTPADFKLYPDNNQSIFESADNVLLMSRGVAAPTSPFIFDLSVCHAGTRIPLKSEQQIYMSVALSRTEGKHTDDNAVIPKAVLTCITTWTLVK